jgi:predicted DNA-binding transcriptional regulator
MIEKLQQIGLNEKECKIYLALLEAETVVSDIAQKTKINRSLLYTLLTQLMQKGIVSYIIKNNVRHYRAAEPEKILSILKEKQQIFRSLLPELHAYKGIKKKKPIVEVFEGKEGIKSILNDVLRVKKEWYAFDVPGKGPSILGVTAHIFQKQRQKAKIPLSVICVKTKDGIKRGKDFEKMQYTKVKYMSEQYKSPASHWVYGNTLAIIFWYEEFPFAIRVIDNNLAKSYKSHFNALWKYCV